MIGSGSVLPMLCSLIYSYCVDKADFVLFIHSYRIIGVNGDTVSSVLPLCDNPQFLSACRKKCLVQIVQVVL